MPKVLILTGDAAESLEVMYPYQRLLEEGYDVEIAAPSKKKLQFVVHDFVEGYDTYTEKPGYTWDADLAFSEVDPSAFAAVVIPGGRAPEYIRNDPDFARIVEHFFSRRSPSPSFATRRSRWRAPACSKVGEPPRTRRCSPMSRPSGRSTSTVRLSSTASWSPRARGPIIRPGCASSSGC